MGLHMTNTHTRVNILTNPQVPLSLRIWPSALAQHSPRPKYLPSNGHLSGPRKCFNIAIVPCSPLTYSEYLWIALLPRLHTEQTGCKEQNYLGKRQIKELGIFLLRGQENILAFHVSFSEYFSCFFLWPYERFESYS